MNAYSHRTRVFIRNPQGKILVLIRRVKFPNESFQDLLMLPGGGIDKGETPVQSAIRETLEETGITLPSVSFLNKHVVNRPIANFEAMHYPGATTITNEYDFFVCDVEIKQRAQVTESEKFQAAMWIYRDRIVETASFFRAHVNDGIIESAVILNHNFKTDYLT